MKLLVLAQTPPPTHGQSLAVAALLAHLAAATEIETRHVNLALSAQATDIGRWQLAKIPRTLLAAARARRLLRTSGPMALYYVPAPAKRGALYRDWAALGLTRPHASKTILHWHAVGLGAWLPQASGLERAATQRLLGRADLAIIQAESARADAAALHPKRVELIRNGVPDPAPQFAPRAGMRSPCQVVFAGLGCQEKGLFDALEGVRLANLASPGAFAFTACGPFASDHDARAFRAQAARCGGAARHTGFISVEERNALFRSADLFCFPSYYPHEGQPAVVLEALAHDLPLVITRWRGIAETLPAAGVHLVPPRAPAEIAAALHAARMAGPQHGALRRHYLTNFTQAGHLAAVTTALRAALSA